LREFDFLTTPDEPDWGESTYYVYPLRFNPEVAGVTREEFVEAVNWEGIKFYQGYVKPLYTQPIYQRRHLFKNGYPFMHQRIETSKGGLQVWGILSKCQRRVYTLRGDWITRWTLFKNFPPKPKRGIIGLGLFPLEGRVRGKA